MGPDRLGLIGVWQRFIRAWFMGMLDALALLGVLLMVQTSHAMKPLDLG